MGTYPGASWSGVSPNKSRRQGRVQLFIVHHWAGGYGSNPIASAIGQRNVFMSANSRDVSPNWQVNFDGSVWEIVPPDEYRAWTTGTIDHQAVTVETQNISGAPNWGISAASHEAIAQLVAWASVRYGFPIQRGAVNSNNTVAVPGVVGHNETPAGKSTGTACPGPSMDLNWIVNRAREIVSPPPPPPPPLGGNVFLIYDGETYPDANTAQYVLISVDGGQFRANYLEDDYFRAVVLAARPALPVTRCDRATFEGFLQRVGYEYGAPIPLVKVEAAGVAVDAAAVAEALAQKGIGGASPEEVRSIVSAAIDSLVLKPSK